MDGYRVGMLGTSGRTQRLRACAAAIGSEATCKYLWQGPRTSTFGLLTLRL
jgi:hypothetical protein